MASGEERHGKEPVAAEEDKFPEGLRVLAVDDNPVCLKVLEALLNMCKYKPTTVTDGMTALKLLRDGGEEQFDLVITDVHMPDMDGFELLEFIGLEMDLPVIMLSVNGEKETIYKGIEHGACDYLVKPVKIKELKNIWQHVVRKNHVAVNYTSSDSDDAPQRVAQPASAEGGAKSKECSKKKRTGGDRSDQNKESTSARSTRKKPRVSWNGELHNRFLEAVNRLGIDRAVPKAILRMMNVHNLSRESVASHLQKYRSYLKRVTTDGPMKVNPPGGDSSARRASCYMDMSHQGTLLPSSAVCFCGSHNHYEAPPSILGAHGLSIEPRNWGMGTAGNGGGMPSHALPWMPETSHQASGPPVSSFARTSDHPMLDAFPTMHADKAYASVLREKLLEASSVVPSSYPGSGSSSFAEMPHGGLLEPANQFPVQPPKFGSQFSAPMVSTHREAQFPYLAGNSSNPWQSVVSSGFPDHMVGAPLLPSSQVNMPQMNQLPSFGASPGQVAMFQNGQQNQMPGVNINNNNTSVGVFSEQMTPLFNMASNIAPAEITNANFSPMTQTGISVAPPAQMVHVGSISSALPNLQDSSVAPTQALNGGAYASGIIREQDGPAAYQQAPDDQPTYNNSNFLDDFFASMGSEDFNPDDAFFGGEY